MNSRLLLICGARDSALGCPHPESLTGRHHPMQCGLQFIWLESERSRLALVSHLPLLSISKFDPATRCKRTP